MDESEWVTGRVTIKVRGVPLDLEMTVPAKPVKPHRMLPIFHQMANSFADIGVQAVEHEGKSVSCKAGCGACCRQPVPVSEIEVYQIAEVVEALPEPRKTEIKQRFADAFAHFEKLGWFDTFRHEYLRQKTSAKEMKKAVKVLHDYYEQGISCPFLENESCSIHLQRPVSCREYLVTTSPDNCERLDGKGIEMVPLPLKPSASLKNIARTDDGKRAGQLLLIQALRYVEQHREHFEEKTGEGWMADFFGGLTENSMPAQPVTAASGRRKKRHPKR